MTIAVVLSRVSMGSPDLGLVQGHLPRAVLVMCKAKELKDVSGVCEASGYEGLCVLSSPFSFMRVACAQRRDVLFSPGCPVRWD